MLEWLSKWRPIFETLYFLASIGLVASVFIGIKQLKLVKKDMSDRTQRAAVEKSIEYLNWFATEFIPKMDKFGDEVLRAGHNFYTGETNRNFVFDNKCVRKEHRDYLNFSLTINSINLLNELEFFSAALMSGLADEKLAYNPLSIVYCSFVERLYVDLCDLRDGPDSTLFSNTIELYNMWKDRLKKDELKKKREQIDKDMSGITDREIKTLGS